MSEYSDLVDRRLANRIKELERKVEDLESKLKETQRILRHGNDIIPCY